MTRLRVADVAEGDELPPLTVRVTRADLVRYAGASGDFNPIHWNERIAREVGLPGVIAHGMLTMALANRLVSDWVGDPAAVIECAARFVRPIPVPDDDIGARLEIGGKVAEVSADGTAKVTMTVRVDGKQVLGRPTARVALG